jgi:sec-independent protein translocase protein TatC
MSSTSASDKQKIGSPALQATIDHLLELRHRLIPALVMILLVFLVLYSFSNELYAFVSEPLRQLLPEGTSMIATDVTSPFFTPFKLTLMAAIFLAMPYVLFQIWRFVAPALYKKEKRLAVPLLVSSVVLFYTGIVFVYFVVFPLVFGFFTRAGPESVAVMTDISRYLDFVLKLFFAFGLVFEIPIVIVMLIATDLTDSNSLSEKRPYIVVGCFVVGMLLTPPDIISQTLLAVPMYLLFELGIVCSKLIEKNRLTSGDIH